ncbi:MAG: hypothetical protein JO112_01615 [Planctomycetes bacterium]|nr:hypothetical protein [Planctomycetota bacterium]
MSDQDLLDEKVIAQRGSWQRVRRWWRGIHPEKGVIIQGWTGWETVEEVDRILPIQTFEVRDKAA